MATIDDLEHFIQHHPDLCDFGCPASDDVMDEAEQFLGLRFPAEYRDFARRWGTLAIGSVEFYGITGGDVESSSVPNAIWFTHVKRKQVGSPKEFVVLCGNEGDDYYCLDTSRSHKTAIVLWEVLSKNAWRTSYDSLFDFILDLADAFRDS